MSKFKNGFSFSELFSNSSGKTSGSGLAGVLTVLIGLLSFIAGIVLIYLNCWIQCDAQAGTSILTQSIALIGIGSALLGVRKVAKDKGIEESNSSEEKTEEIEIINENTDERL